jgi:peptide deformylase
VLQAGAPPLRDVAKEVAPERIESGEIQELISEMVRVCKARGVGLAAPQLGTRLRVIVLEDTVEGMSDVSAEELERQKRKPFAVKVIINPELTPLGDSSAAFFEGCLSVAGYRAVVRRHLKVRCRGLGGDGAPVDFVAEGWQARILQHELDHLNGVLYTDRMETRTFRRVDLLDEPLPGDHAEFGRAVVLGESNEPVVRGNASAAEDAEARVKARKNRRR